MRRSSGLAGSQKGSTEVLRSRLNRSHIVRHDCAATNERACMSVSAGSCKNSPSPSRELPGSESRVALHALSPTASGLEPAASCAARTSTGPAKVTYE